METTLRVIRKWFTDKSTISEWFLDNSTERICFGLEDKVREPGIKVYGQTAIPAGKYRVVLEYSNRFNRITPLLLNVPNYEGIRIHPGNTSKDTLGCLLPGLEKDYDIVLGSRTAYLDVYMKIDRAMQAGKVFVETINEIVSDTRTPDG